MCPALKGKLGFHAAGYLQVAKEQVDQKHTGEHCCKIEIGFHVRPESIGRYTNKIPVFETEIPDLEEEPKYRRPKEKDCKFAWPFQDQAVVPAPPQEAIEKQNESIPGEWIGVGVEGRDVIGSAPKGENDCQQAENHHQYADGAIGHGAMGSRILLDKGQFLLFAVDEGVTQCDQGLFFVCHLDIICAGARSQVRFTRLCTQSGPC